MKILFFSDRIVDWLQERLQLPWEDMNLYLTDLLPNRGMEFPYMIGRFAAWGILAGILLILIQLITRQGINFSARSSRMAFQLDAALAAVCMWVIYTMLRNVFFTENAILGPAGRKEIADLFGQIFRGEGDLQAFLWLALGLFAAAIGLLAFFLLTLYPRIYYESLLPVYGKLLTPFAFVMNVGLMSGVVALIFAAFYTFFACGGGVFLLKAWIAMLILAAGLRMIHYFLALAIHTLVALIIASGGKG